PASDRFSANRDCEGNADRLDCNAGLEYRSIGRHDDRNLVTQPGQFDRQSAANVGQTAGFGEWDRLGRSYHNLHNPFLPAAYTSVATLENHRPAKAQRPLKLTDHPRKLNLPGSFVGAEGMIEPLTGFEPLNSGIRNGSWRRRQLGSPKIGAIECNGTDH